MSRKGPESHGVNICGSDSTSFLRFLVQGIRFQRNILLTQQDIGIISYVLRILNPDFQSKCRGNMTMSHS
jgi:hypothetical protein